MPDTGLALPWPGQYLGGPPQQAITLSNSASTALAPSSLGWSTRFGRFLGLNSITPAELEAKYANEHSRFIEIDGTRVHYRIEGSGPPLVLVHGVMAQLQTWDGWVDRLAQHFTMYRLDVPGFGLTGPAATRNYTPEYSLQFFEQIRVALGLERFYLAGNSLGGFLSWYYAAHHPERVERLILIDPLSYAQKAPTIMRFAASMPIRWIAPHCVPRPFIDDSLRQVYGDLSRMAPGTADRYHEMLLREGNRQAMVDYFLRAEAYFAAAGPYTRKLTELRCPTLLMWGEQDRWILPSHVESFRRDVPGLEVKLYPGVGHVPMEEIPEQTAADALAFLTRR
jgi:pimeloyl-ACP methyl ester carboxylesterase